MKSLGRWCLGVLRRTLASWLRPLIRRVDRHIVWLVAEGVRPVVVDELERRVRPRLDATQAEVRESIDRTKENIAYLKRSMQENTLLLDGLTRELVRLQMQLDDLVAHQDEESAERLMIG